MFSPTTLMVHPVGAFELAAEHHVTLITRLAYPYELTKRGDRHFHGRCFHTSQKAPVGLRFLTLMWTLVSAFRFYEAMAHIRVSLGKAKLHEHFERRGLWADFLRERQSWG